MAPNYFSKMNTNKDFSGKQEQTRGKVCNGKFINEIHKL
jgi:hypothetical protein